MIAFLPCFYFYPWLPFPFFFCRSSMLVFQCECMLISKWHNNYLLTFYNIWLILTDANYLKLIRLVYHSLIPFLFILFNLLSFNFFVFSGIHFIIQYWHTVWYHLWCSVYSVTEWIPVTYLLICKMSTGKPPCLAMACWVDLHIG